MLARALEAQGVATTSISMVREHTEKVKPPRALFVPFPYGHALGRPDDPELQHRVLRAALDLLAAPSGPVLADFPDDAEPGGEPVAPSQASAVAPAGVVATDPVAEITSALAHHDDWRAAHRGRTAFGLAGLPAARFADVVRFLQAFAAGGDADMPERPADVPLPAFVRWCADDLKAIYLEGQMARKPAAGGDEILRRFWAETAVGQLLRRVRDRLDASDDPRWKAAAFGVAR